MKKILFFLLIVCSTYIQAAQFIGYPHTIDGDTIYYLPMNEPVDIIMPTFDVTTIADFDTASYSELMFKNLNNVTDTIRPDDSIPTTVYACALQSGTDVCLDYTFTFIGALADTGAYKIVMRETTYGDIMAWEATGQVQMVLPAASDSVKAIFDYDENKLKFVFDQPVHSTKSMPPIHFEFPSSISPNDFVDISSYSAPTVNGDTLIYDLMAMYQFRDTITSGRPYFVKLPEWIVTFMSGESHKGKDSIEVTIVDSPHLIKKIDFHQQDSAVTIYFREPIDTLSGQIITGTVARVRHQPNSFFIDVPIETSTMLIKSPMKVVLKTPYISCGPCDGDPVNWSFEIPASVFRNLSMGVTNLGISGLVPDNYLKPIPVPQTTAIISVTTIDPASHYMLMDWDVPVSLIEEVPMRFLHFDSMGTYLGDLPLIHTSNWNASNNTQNQQFYLDPSQTSAVMNWFNAGDSVALEVPFASHIVGDGSTDELTRLQVIPVEFNTYLTLSAVNSSMVNVNMGMPADIYFTLSSNELTPLDYTFQATSDNESVISSSNLSAYWNADSGSVQVHLTEANFVDGTANITLHAASNVPGDTTSMMIQYTVGYGGAGIHVKEFTYDESIDQVLIQWSQIVQFDNIGLVTIEAYDDGFFTNSQAPIVLNGTDNSVNQAGDYSDFYLTTTQASTIESWYAAGKFVRYVIQANAVSDPISNIPNSAIDGSIPLYQSETENFYVVGEQTPFVAESMSHTMCFLIFNNSATPTFSISNSNPAFSIVSSVTYASMTQEACFDVSVPIGYDTTTLGVTIDNSMFNKTFPIYVTSDKNMRKQGVLNAVIPETIFVDPNISFTFSINGWSDVQPPAFMDLSVVTSDGALVPVANVIIDSLGSGLFDVHITATDSFITMTPYLTFTLTDGFGNSLTAVVNVDISQTQDGVTIGMPGSPVRKPNETFVDTLYVNTTTHPEAISLVAYSENIALIPNSNITLSKLAGSNSMWELIIMTTADTGFTDIRIEVTSSIDSNFTLTEYLAVYVEEDFLPQDSVSLGIPPDFNWATNGFYHDTIYVNSSSPETIELYIHSTNQGLLDDSQIMYHKVPGSSWEWVMEVTTYDIVANPTDLNIKIEMVSTIDSGFYQVHYAPVTIFSQDSIGPGPIGSDCMGLCVYTASFEHNFMNSKFIIEFNEPVQVEQNTEILIQSLNYDSHDDSLPDIIGEMKIPVDFSSYINGNSFEYTLSDLEMMQLKEMDLKGNDVEVIIDANVFKGQSSMQLNYFEQVHMGVFEGAKFQVYSAHYDPFEKSIKIEFDGELNESTFAFGSFIQVGEGLGGSNLISIPVVNYVFGNSYDTNDSVPMVEMYDSTLCVGCYPSDTMNFGPMEYHPKEMTIYLIESDYMALEQYSNKNNLYLNVVDGFISSMSGLPLEESTFQYDIPLGFGTEYGSNWVDWATLNEGNGELIIQLNQDIVEHGNVDIDMYSGITSVFIMLGIPDSIYSQDGPPQENQPNFIYVRVNVDEVLYTSLDNTLSVTLTDENLLDVQNWEMMYGNNYADKLIMYSPYGVMKNTQGEFNSEFITMVKLSENSLDSIDTTNVIDSIVEPDPDLPLLNLSAPVVEVKKFEGVAYFSMEEHWLVSVSTTTQNIAPELMVFESSYTTGSRVYLEADKYYTVIREVDSLYSAQSVVVANDYFAIDLSIEQSGTAYKIQFLNKEKDEIDNATFGYVINNTSLGMIDTVLDYTNSSINFYGFSGDSIMVSAFISDLEGADSLFVQSFSAKQEIVLNASPEIILPAGEWSMVSFGSQLFAPVILDQSVSLFWWDDDGVFDLLYDKYLGREDIDNVLPGQGAWVSSEFPQTIPVTFDTTVVSLDIELGEEGWCQVGNPYGFNLKTEAFGNQEFFRWDGSNYYKVNYLEPGIGYWATIARSETVEIERLVAWGGVAEAASEALYKKAVVTETDWEMGIALRSSDNVYHDVYNSIGVKPLAENSIDETDKRELPAAMGDAVVVSFLQDGKELRSDYRSQITTSAVWNMYLGTTIKNGVDATLEFDGFENVKSLGYTPM